VSAAAAQEEALNKLRVIFPQESDERLLRVLTREANNDATVASKILLGMVRKKKNQHTGNERSRILRLCLCFPFQIVLFFKIVCCLLRFCHCSRRHRRCSRAQWAQRIGSSARNVYIHLQVIES
jgi:hypothetical protein